MRKCVRCNIIFHSEDRGRCLYCNTMLVLTEKGILLDEKPFDVFRGVADFLKSAGRGELDRKQYIVGSYFRSRSFSFTYAFCRNELKMGKAYPRFLIRSLDFSALLSLPWLLVNVIDSILFRSIYVGFCEKCQHKYQPQGDIIGHEKNSCDYCLEYSVIVKDIMTGQIAKTEDQHKRRAQEDLARGQRSAYRDLCSQEKGWDVVFDVLSIWLTICLAVFLLARLLVPSLIKGFDQLQKESQQEEIIVEEERP